MSGGSQIKKIMSGKKAVKADEVSFEVGACYDDRLVPKGLKMTEAEKQVFVCLLTYKSNIVNAESSFKVSRIAIAGAIAWEALENSRTSSVRGPGLGKVHVFNIDKEGALRGAKAWLRNAAPFPSLIPVGMILGAVAGSIDLNTSAAQVEQRGYLPKRSIAERKAALTVPASAIGYIGAIMGGIADISENEGFGNIRGNVEIITNVYQGKTLDTWERHLKAKKEKGDKELKGGNAMDKWVVKNISYLVSAVGSADPFNLEKKLPVDQASISAESLEKKEISSNSAGSPGRFPFSIKK